MSYSSLCPARPPILRTGFLSKLVTSLFVLLAAATASFCSAAITPLPFVVQAVIADRQDSQIPDRVHLDGMIGARITNNALNRLLEIDVDRLLEGYRTRPGRQSWDGEHIGKWIHAATLAWVYTGDARLRTKLDGAVTALMACQLSDGYLGTYLPADRWTEWDVWAHKYNLIGLITYMRYTGNQTPLACCRKMADLLCNEFGDGKRDIIPGEHVGMASTSVLEPMVWLYRLTGETRYRDFCTYILSAWEHPNGPKIVSTLLSAKRVDRVGDAKAYEMLSCINGMLEWYRVTGDPDLLTAATNAWDDISTKRRYITGTASYYETFHDDFDLPNIANVGETCVTVTWLQLNLHLLRLTGQARYANEVERTAYNQLEGAQRPDGRAWGYYVQMEGVKPYTSNLDGQCCLSSGPRGFALLPTEAVTTDVDGVVVNSHEAGTAQLQLRNGTPVSVVITTTYPAQPDLTIDINLQQAATFAVKIRIPAWCPSATLKLGAQILSTAAGADGYATIQRTWQAGDRLTLTLPPTPRIVAGDHTNVGKEALCYGPLVLASDSALDPAGNTRVSIPSSDISNLTITPQTATGAYLDWPNAKVYRVTSGNWQTVLAPFATAGVGMATDFSALSQYQVWMSVSDPNNASLLANGTESRSRPGNVVGSIINGPYVVTWDGTSQAQDWYAVTLSAPTTINQVVFTHGKRFGDGGWFDASVGKPQVQVQTSQNGAWTTVGELSIYPATTATDGAGLADGTAFTCQLSQSYLVWGVRVIGKPASGTNPQQAFSSCGGLAGYYKGVVPVPNNPGLLAGGAESRSRQGNVAGSIITGPFVVTWDGTSQAQDWYAVTLSAQTTINQVVFAHGKRFWDGGWFDASAGKPQVQVQTSQNGAWTTVGQLSTYPATTATDGAGLVDGTAFTCQLSQSYLIWGVRMIGKPASGTNPQQAFSSCGGLAAYLTTTTVSGQTVPGKIEAENYAAMAGVQKETTADTGGGQNVGYIDAGDWLEYTLNVPTAGVYQLDLRVAGVGGTGGRVTLKPGTASPVTLTLPVTGGWQTWTTVTTPVTLNAGVQTLRVEATVGGFDLNWLQFNSSSSFVSGLAQPLKAAEIADPAISDDAADPDGDGIPNLLEYKLGGDPSRPITGKLEPRTVNGAPRVHYEINFKEGRDDVVLVAEVSTDLKTWSAADASFVQTITSNNDGTALLAVEYPTPATGGVFIRLKASRVP